MLIGSHLSVSKGFDQTAKIAADIGANIFQFFTRNPRGGAARAILPAEAVRWQSAREKYNIRQIIGHLPYTVNMASPAERPYAFAKMVISDDLNRMSIIQAEYLVVHPGSHTGSGREKGIERIVNCLEECLSAYGAGTVLLLETMAGQGSEIGTLTDIREIMQALGRPRQLGVCIDLAHLTAAGYDFRQKEQTDRLLEDIESIIGLELIKVIHLNDSKAAPGTHKDRHARIGQGYLGKEGLLNIMTQPAFRNLPMVLETPVDHYSQYGEEIALIRSWLE